MNNGDRLEKWCNDYMLLYVTKPKEIRDASKNHWLEILVANIGEDRSGDEFMAERLLARMMLADSLLAQ